MRFPGLDEAEVVVLPAEERHPEPDSADTAVVD